MADRTCSINECSRPRKSRGWCNTHYERFRLKGSTNLPPEPKRRCAGDDCEKSIGTYRNSSGLCKECYRRRHYVANREHELSCMKAWRSANREYDRARWKLFYASKMASDPEYFSLKCREYGARRRAWIGGDKVDYTAVLNRDGMNCYLCQGVIDSFEDLHFDHVRPLSRGGEHVAENIRPTHAECNLRKGAKLLEELN
jgi:5-methylcytosine-specific restriction endonuclease McrA